MKKILVIGSLNMDIILKMDAMPQVGETILGRELHYSAGGKGANQAYAVGKLGGQVTMLGCVGNDAHGAELTASLSRAGVNVDRIRRVDSQPTGTAVIYLDNAGANSIVVVSGANSACDVAYLKENDDAFRQCDYILLQMEIPEDAVWYAIERGHELGKTVLLNPAPAPDSIPERLLDQIDYITPNETELARLTGVGSESMDDIAKGAAALAERGVRNVLVTLGAKGSYLTDGTRSHLFPATDQKPVDTTAAGDCFNAAVVTALAEGCSIDDAMVFANAAAGLAVTKLGAQSAMPAREEVNRFLLNAKQ